MGEKKLNEEHDDGYEIPADEGLMMTEALISSLEDKDADDDSAESFLPNPLSNNPYFRCLGYHGENLVFSSKRRAFIQYVKVDKMGSKICLSLAPHAFWHKVAPKMDEKGRETSSVMWDNVMDLMFRATEDAGLWNDRNQHEQGARYDRGRVVFHTGERVWMDGVGLMSPGDVQGEHCYTARIGARLPDYENPFPAEAPEIRQMLNIIKALAWRADSRALSEMTLFGYLYMAPICGLLDWRPHVWLDGARGDGKTWVVQNIVNRILGPHCEMVKSNSTESGLRNLLHARSIPTVFDEAEGSSARDKSRMEEIISLARHTSSETDAVVAQGVSGGGASRRYEVSSMFFFASIATRIDKPSDQTRFARISLGPGVRGHDFVENIEVPALKLMTPAFTDKFVARSVLNARHVKDVIRVMTAALMKSGMERRVADVYGVFAAGAWMALRDGIPADEDMCLAFIASEFGALEQIQSVNTELSHDRDHDRVIRHIMSASRRIETGNGPVVTERVGVLMRIVAGIRDGEDDSLVTMADALKELNNIGLRPACNNEACDPGDHVTHFLVHRKSDVIRSLLEKTSYETGFSELLLQYPGVVVAVKTTRFRGYAPERGLLVPIEAFFGTCDTQDPEPTPTPSPSSPTPTPHRDTSFAHTDAQVTSRESSSSSPKGEMKSDQREQIGDPFDEDAFFADIQEGVADSVRYTNSQDHDRSASNQDSKTSAIFETPKDRSRSSSG